MKKHALCGFCSGEARASESGGGEYMAGDFAVECKSCGARGPYRSTAEKAWAEWDELFEDDAEAAKDAELASLKARCEGMRASPWPIDSVLNTLCGFAEMMLYERNYDGHGHETLKAACEAGRKLESALASLPAEGLVERVAEENPYLLHGDELKRAERARHRA